MEDPHAQPIDQYPTDLELEILDLLRRDAHSAELLAQMLSQEGGEQVGVDDVLLCLEGLASRGFVRASGEGPHAAE